MIQSIRLRSKIFVIISAVALQIILAFLASTVATKYLEFNGVVVGSLIYLGGFAMLFIGLRSAFFKGHLEGGASSSSAFLGLRLIYFFVCFFISIVIVKVPLLSLAFGLVQAKISTLAGVFWLESQSRNR
jgi:hypothetical protein